MALKDDIESEVKQIFRDRWEEKDGRVVPESDSLTLGNDGIWLDATVLYADMADSTALVDTQSGTFAAEVYKAFLHAAAKIIRSESGEITAYDGDRIMAVFVGDSKNSSAVRSALKINYARVNIINPAIKAQYQNIAYELQHVVGIDVSRLFVARTGIRGANDLVWVGRAANYAAKLSALTSDYPTNVTKGVYDVMNASLKTYTDGRGVWEQVTWKDRQIYRSNWWWWM